MQGRHGEVWTEEALMEVIAQTMHRPQGAGPFLAGMLRRSPQVKVRHGRSNTGLYLLHPPSPS